MGGGQSAALCSLVGTILLAVVPAQAQPSDEARGEEPAEEPAQEEVRDEGSSPRHTSGALGDPGDAATPDAEGPDETEEPSRSPSSPPRLAAREQATATLSWVRSTGADDCPSASRMRGAVVEILGRNPFSLPAAQHFEVVVSNLRPGWAAVLYIRGPDGHVIGTRDIRGDGEDCLALAQAVALAVAVGIEPIFDAPMTQDDVTIPPEVSDAVAEPRPEPALDPTPAQAAPAPQPEPEPTAAGPSVWLGPYFGLGFVPDPALPGAALGVRGTVHLDVLSWGAGVVYLPTRVVEPVSISLIALHVEGCGVWAPFEVLELRGCLRGMGGAHSIELRNATGADNPGLFGWGAIGLAVEATLRLGPLVVTADVAPSVSVVQRSFARGADPLFEETPVGLFAGAGLGLAL